MSKSRTAESTREVRAQRRGEAKLMIVRTEEASFLFLMKIPIAAVSDARETH
jgi:hypothetical protein